MICSSREVCMLIIWLCLQMAATAATWTGLIYIVDSFWAVALRSMRVVFWWLKELVMFYIFSDTTLSLAHPNASLWSFVMFCGIGLVVTSMVVDRRHVDAMDDAQADKQFMARQFPDLHKAV